MYYLVILLISYVFYTVMTNLDKRGWPLMSDLAQKRGFALPKIKGNAIVMALYLLFLLLPIYWLLNMSLKTNTEILNSFTLWPADLTFDITV